MTNIQGQDGPDFVEVVSAAARDYEQALATVFEGKRSKLVEDFEKVIREKDDLIEKLLDENEALKTQSPRDAAAGGPPQGSTSAGFKHLDKVPRRDSPAFGAVSTPPQRPDGPQSHGELGKAYSKLYAQFQILDSNFKKAKEALERRKEEKERLQAQIAHLTERVESMQEKNANAESALTAFEQLPQASTCVDLPGEDTTPKQRHTSNQGIETESVMPPPEFLAATEPAGSPNEQTSPSSTQSGPADGQDGIELPTLPSHGSGDSVCIKPEPSSDTPVVVSERSVKKRKRDEEPAGTTDGIKVKVEPSPGSSPASRQRRFVLRTEESLDLGEVGQRIATPRKRKDFERALDDTPITVARDPPPLPMTNGPGLTDLYVKATPKVVRPAPLTPIDANRRLGKPITRKKPDSKRRKRDAEEGVGSLAEDGADYKFEANQEGVQPVTPAAKGRLDNLLNTPGGTEQSKPAILRSSNRKTNTPATPRDGDLLMPKPRELPFGGRSDRGSARTTSTDQPITPAQRNPDTVPPKSRPSMVKKMGLLRNKPLSNLKLGDFKINPEANEGVDYAFSDVVRNKDDRAQLPGCTDPHCCGDEFRAIAISQRPNSPLTKEQRQEEQKLMEEFLGDLSYRLATMTKPERLELWVKAKTHELANKYGKHRHRFARKASPPGFWNADFPSTQEMEADRVEAARREERTVEERYREALKTGGRWLFRDE